MNALSLRLVRHAVLALAVGVGLAILFGFNRSWGALLRPLHAELNLFGGLTLLIYGMAYHMLTRFIGAPLRFTRLAAIQSWLAIGGVWLAVVGWLPISDLAWIRLLGGVLQLLATLLFAFLLYPILTYDPHKEAL
jgi:uncharacterized membrane protein